MKPAGAVVVAFLVSSCITLDLAETLTVTMEKKMTAHLATDVIIPCNISGYRMPELDTTKTGVLWYRRTDEEDTESLLFSLISEDQEPRRNGTRMNVDDLRKGNAALFLPKIQLNEGGTYRCVVTVTPNKAEATSTVEIVAQPLATLDSKKITTKGGQEVTLSCAATNFYPKSIEILWQKYSKPTQYQEVPAEDVCTQGYVNNNDGTFSITSKLKLSASLKNDGYTYHCIIKHKSCTTPHICNASLKVTARPLDPLDPKNTTKECQEELLRITIWYILSMILITFMQILYIIFSRKGASAEI